MRATVIDLNGDSKSYSGVDHVAFVNQDSHGTPPGTKLDDSDVSSVLIINVNGFASVHVEE